LNTLHELIKVKVYDIAIAIASCKPTITSIINEPFILPFPPVEDELNDKWNTSIEYKDFNYITTSSALHQTLMGFDDTNEIALKLVDVLIKNYPEDVHARSTRGIALRIKSCLSEVYHLN